MQKTNTQANGAPRCKKCGGAMTVQAISTGSTTRMHSRGLLWTLGRWFLILCTCGLWLLVGKSRGKAHTRSRVQSMAICQICGHRQVLHG